MANEFRLRYNTTGLVLYTVLVRGSDGALYNGSTFETPLTANWTTYDIAMTEQSTTRLYYGTMPAVSAGLYDYLVYQRVGGTPAVTDTQVGQGSIDWNGSADTGLGQGVAIRKNQALANFEFVMIDSSDHATPLTGLTVTAQRSLDGATFAACANSVTELSNGVYKISLAAADLNGNTVTLLFTATGADATIITLATQA